MESKFVWFDSGQEEAYPGEFLRDADVEDDEKSNRVIFWWQILMQALMNVEESSRKDVL